MGVLLRGRTHEVIAGEVGMPRSTISSILFGASEPKARTVLRLAQALGCSTDRFLWAWLGARTERLARKEREARVAEILSDGT